MTRLAVVVGSVRPNRVGGSIAQWVVDQANEIEGVEAEIVDIASFNLPLFAEEEIRREVVFVVPRQLAGTDFDAGFALRREGYTNWFNGKPLRTEVAR